MTQLQTSSFVAVIQLRQNLSKTDKLTKKVREGQSLITEKVDSYFITGVYF